MGRPSDYTPEWAEEFCEKVAGGLSLHKICEADDQPAERTVYAWLNDKPEFSQNYARARERRAERDADKLVEIADDLDIDHNHKRLMIETRKWIASKMLPKKYGDKVETEHTGGLEVRIVRADG